MNRTIALGALAASGMLAAHANAAYTITQSAGAAPTYDITLNFDEPGTPTGIVPDTTWLAGWDLLLQSGDGQDFVGDATGVPGQSWLGTGNSFTGAYGVFMTFGSEITEFSAQFWDPSGPPTFFGGGMAVILFNDGVDVAFEFYTPAWGGVGDTWYNCVATDGMVFDEIRVLGFGFFPTTYMDNASWNKVPAPGAAALLGVAGLAGLRRRRA
jgi:hypothetical protein